MKITVVSLCAIGEGEEIAVSVVISSEEAGKEERRRLILPTESVGELRLAKGEISPETFDLMEEAAVKRSALKKGLTLLGYSSCTKRTMASKLRERGFSREVADETAEKLASLGYIREEEDVLRVVELCLRKGYGKRRVADYLLHKGFPKEIASRAIAEVPSGTWQSLCSEALRKKIGRASLPEEPNERFLFKKKCYAYLARLGFSSDEISHAINRFFR